MKYKVKNTVTGEESICEKVVVDGFNYYVNNDEIIGFYYNPIENKIYNEKNKKRLEVINKHKRKKIIATTNPSLDLPRVIDEVETITEELCTKKGLVNNTVDLNAYAGGLIDGYNKAKETYYFTKDDMVEFTEWLITKSFREGTSDYTTEELFDIWQEQRTIEILVK